MNHLASNLRNKKGYSVRELTDQLDVYQERYYGWESGRNNPSIDNTIMLADYYNLTLDELILKDLSKL